MIPTSLIVFITIQLAYIAALNANSVQVIAYFTVVSFSSDHYSRVPACASDRPAIAAAPKAAPEVTRLTNPDSFPAFLQQAEPTLLLHISPVSAPLELTRRVIRSCNTDIVLCINRQTHPPHIMSGVTSRLSGLLGHFTGSPAPAPFEHRFNHHTLSPTFFLPRAAAIEPNVGILLILSSRKCYFAKCLALLS
jgi:hypothetical protein